MTHHGDLQLVRQRVRNWLRARFPSFSLDELSESILLQEARVVGHQFRCRNIVARWIATQQRIDFFTGEQLVHSLDLRQNPNLDAAA